MSIKAASTFERDELKQSDSPPICKSASETAPELPATATLEYAENPLLERLTTFFRVATAVAGDELREAMRIRYQVYCVENPFESRDDHPDGIERDAFDSHSVHSLLVHRASGLAMGTARLIMPVRHDLERSFPIQQVCRHSELNLLPLDRMAEVSRFSISKQFRRRRCDTLYEGVGPNEQGRSMVPLMSLGLIQSLVRMSVEGGITHWCATMEPTLLRLLAGMSIWFEPLGPLVQYHGARQPCYCEVRPMLERVKNEQRVLWEVLTSRGTLQYQAPSLVAKRPCAFIR